jgi:ribosomal protein S27E
LGTNRQSGLTGSQESKPCGNKRPLSLYETWGCGAPTPMECSTMNHCYGKDPAVFCRRADARPSLLQAGTLRPTPYSRNECGPPLERSAQRVRRRSWCPKPRALRFTTLEVPVVKKRFSGSWPWGFLMTALICLPFMVVAALLVKGDTTGSVTANATKIAGTLAGFFWVLVFPRARKAYRQSEQTAMIADAREKGKNRPLAVGSDFFEALCPRCGLKRAIFADDPDRVSCTCGARLVVKRTGEGGTLGLPPESGAQSSSSDLSTETEKWRPVQAYSSPLRNRRVTTLDGELMVYQGCDSKSAAVGSPPRGTEIYLGSVAIVDGREWVEATLPNGDRGYALGPSVRSHCT